MTVKYNFKIKPFDHQRQALEKGWHRQEFGLFMEMGTGKSKVLIDNLGLLFLNGQINFALVLAPKGVYRNWVTKEIPEHMSDDIPYRMIRWVSSPNKKQQEEMRSVKDHFAGPDNLCHEHRGFLYKERSDTQGEWMARALGETA